MRNSETKDSSFGVGAERIKCMHATAKQKKKWRRKKKELQSLTHVGASVAR